MKKTILLIFTLFILSSCGVSPSEGDKNITLDFVKQHIDNSYLDLRSLGLTKVPEFSKILPQAVLEDVLFIDLSNNEIRKIPDEFKKFPNLKEVNLSFNKIKKLENLNNIKLLRKVEVYENELKSVNLKNVPNLKYLDLSYNNLESGDLEDIFKLTGLTELQLLRNNIKSIEGIEALTSLEVIKLEFNQIKDISPLDSLKNLKFVSVAENPLDKALIEKWIKFTQDNMGYTKEEPEVIKLTQPEEKTDKDSVLEI